MTAVNWLIEELKKVHHPTEAMIMYAKKLEKQQIMDAFNQGYREGWIDSISGDCTNDQDVETFEDANLYYTSTYGSKGSDEHIVDTNKMVEDTFKVWECCGME